MTTSDEPTTHPKSSWMKRLAALQVFAEQNLRLPSRLANQPERSLATWLANQRRALQTGALATDRTALLDVTFPNWKGRDHNAAWESHLQDVAEWKIASGRWPSATSDSNEESRIGSWLATQRTAATQSSLTPERTHQLNVTAPGWATVTIFDNKWSEALADISAYREQHGRLPRQSAADPEVKLLAVWVSRQRGRAKAGTLTSARRALLDSSLPDWDWISGNRHPNN